MNMSRIRYESSNTELMVAMPDDDTFMERGPLTRFVDIVITLSEIYNISTEKLHIFYDVSGGCIAFNCRGTIYLNLRYFEVWRELVPI